MVSEEKLEREVAAIGDLSRQDLVDAWIKAHGRQPPKGVKRPLLELSAAWYQQAKRLGGLSAATTKALLRSQGANRIGKAAGTSTQTYRPSLKGGTRLVRELNGRTHIVDVTETGFVVDGRPYRSLSAIAYRITETGWSGPRFFGL